MTIAEQRRILRRVKHDLERERMHLEQKGESALALDVAHEIEGINAAHESLALLEQLQGVLSKLLPHPEEVTP